MLAEELQVESSRLRGAGEEQDTEEKRMMKRMKRLIGISFFLIWL